MDRCEDSVVAFVSFPSVFKEEHKGCCVPFRRGHKHGRASSVLFTSSSLQPRHGLIADPPCRRPARSFAKDASPRAGAQLTKGAGVAEEDGACRRERRAGTWRGTTMVEEPSKSAPAAARAASSFATKAVVPAAFSAWALSFAAS